jgi:heterodisulfide reductase subunit A-like polyferredoxin
MSYEYMRNNKLDLNEKLRKLSCGVLIIGGGGAGLSAAIEAHDSGEDVFIVSKSSKGDPHTVLAGGAINGALATMDPNDNWIIHAADTLKGGAGNDEIHATDRNDYVDCGPGNDITSQRPGSTYVACERFFG